MTELSKITADLIRFKSTKENPQEIQNCLSYIKDYFKDCKVFIKEFEDGGMPSLFISTRNTKKPSILFNGHIDVVEGDGEQFEPKEKHGKLYGRGAVDMKGGVAVIMKVCKHFAQQEPQPDIGLMIVADEEQTGNHGTGYQVKKGYGGKFIIDPEPNQSKQKNGMDITVAHKGVLWLKLIAHGKSAHAARPWLGNNAADMLVTGYKKIKTLFEQPTPENQWLDTINLGVLSSGNSPNRIPDYAEMILDIRFIEKTKPLHLIKKIKEISGLEVEVLDLADLLFNNDDHPIIQKLKETVELVNNQPCQLLHEHGSSDMRFTSAKGIPSVILGPIGKNFHGKDEYVDIKSLDVLFEIYKKFIESMQ